MPLKKTGLLLIFLLFFTTLAGAATLDDVITALEIPFRATSAGRIADFQADFFQQSRLASIDRVQRAHGEVSFMFTPADKGPEVAKFRWTYQEPAVQEFISDGQKLWAYQPENQQVIESDIEQVQAQKSNPLYFLNHLGELSAEFLVNWADPRQDESGNPLLMLRPQQESPLVQDIQLVVNRAAIKDYQENRRTGRFFPIVGIRVVDPNGNKTIFDFKNIQVNKGLSEKYFDFVPPAGVKVLHPTAGQPLGY